MYELRISDTLYEKASHAAEAQRISVIEFIEDAVKLHLEDAVDEDATSFFTPDRIAEIRESAAQARTGNNISFEDHKAEMRKMRAEWLANHAN
jgi:hypothetical protein